MQYQVDPTDQTPENGPKPLFRPFGSFKNAFLWFLDDPPWPCNVARCWKTFSFITICNIKSIQQTKLLKMAKNLIFSSLDHSKMHFCDVWMILHDLVTLPNVIKHLMLSQYAISRWSDGPNSRKWPITGWIIQNSLRVTQRFFSKINEIFPGHAVFARSSPKPCSFISNHQICIIHW